MSYYQGDHNFTNQTNFINKTLLIKFFTNEKQHLASYFFKLANNDHGYLSESHIETQEKFLRRL